VAISGIACAGENAVRACMSCMMSTYCFGTGGRGRVGGGPGEGGRLNMKGTILKYGRLESGDCEPVMLI
jgi:hypothetical protein